MLQPAYIMRHDVDGLTTFSHFFVPLSLYTFPVTTITISSAESLFHISSIGGVYTRPFPSRRQ